MKAALEVRGLCKNYPAFWLKEVSFSLRPGRITGFIGRNGAGKSTTLNSLMNFVHPDGGEIIFWGRQFEQAEDEIKQRVGFVSSGMSYYPNKRLKTISRVTSSFYSGWEQNTYESYMEEFALDENKTPSQLSNGMKIKYALALALSHKADLLILDEPTSGLDPVSREELLEIFMQLCDRGKTILFSTHITSDLDKCADDIVYIKNGGIIAQGELSAFAKAYQVAEYREGQLDQAQLKLLIGVRRIKNGSSALITRDADIPAELCREASLEDIMIHLESEGE